MNILRFVAENSRDVMRLVRDALGPDALIISNRRVDTGIEIMAAAGEDSFDETSSHDDSAALSDKSSAHDDDRGPAQPQSEPYFEARSPDEKRSDDDAMSRTAGNATGQEARHTVTLDRVAPAHAVAAYSVPSAPPVQSAPQISTPSMAMHRGASAYAAMPTSEALQRIDGGDRTTSASSSPDASVRPAYAPPSAPAISQASTSTSAQPSAALSVPQSAPPSAARSVASELSAPVASAPAAPARSASANVQAPSPSVVSPLAPVASTSASPVVGAQFQDAISSLQRTFETRIEGLMWGKGALGQPAGAALFRGLLEAGFSAPLARALLERLPKGYSAEQALAWAREEITTHLPIQTDEAPLWETGGVFALVGPTGVGKTTTLAKLAARCVARVGRDQVAMLTTDNFRIGAVEQLQIYGQLLSIPTRSVRDAASLRQTLEEWGSRRIVLVDTTGISQRDRKLAQQAAMLVGGGRPVRRLLVLNAASQGDTLDEVAHAYRHGVGEDVCGCIITKLDEASRLGSVLDTAIRHRLPIHYVAGGQKVPEDFSLPSAARLVEHAFSSVAADKPLFAADESDMAALWGAATDRAESQDSSDLQAQRRKLMSLAQPFHTGSGDAEQAFKALNASLEVFSRDATFMAARADWSARQEGAATGTQAEGLSPTASTARATTVDAAQAYQKMIARHATTGVLAVHGKISTRAWHTATGSLSSALWMDAAGRGLGAPLHQLILPQGTISSFSDGTESRTADASVRARIAAISPAAVDAGVIHLLDSAPRALYQALGGDGARWLSRYAGSTRVVHDDCPTTLQAIGKSLGYLPVDLVDHPALFAQLTGSRDTAAHEGDLTVWAAATAVTPTGRQAGAPQLRMVTVKWIDPISGAVRNQLYGMSNIGTQEADVHAMVLLLLQQDAGRRFFPLLGAALSNLPQCGPSYGLARRVSEANRLAAACWRLSAAADAAPLRTLMTALSGKAALSPKGMPAAVGRLFAMLDMTAAG